jgi:hypothetical protein
VRLLASCKSARRDAKPCNRWLMGRHRRIEPIGSFPGCGIDVDRFSTLGWLWHSDFADSLLFAYGAHFLNAWCELRSPSQQVCKGQPGTAEVGLAGMLRAMAGLSVALCL